MPDIKSLNQWRSTRRFATFGTLSLLVVACERDAPPSQEAVDQAWRRADQAVQHSVESEHQVQHERRLRDIDRLRLEADVAAVETELHALRGMCSALAAVTIAVMVWLAVEVRRRRVLSATLSEVLNLEGGGRSIDDESDSSCSDR